MTILRVTHDIFTHFPDVTLGVVIAHEIDNANPRPEVISLLRQEEAHILEQFASSQINAHPHIATWREAYRKFGAKPKDYPSSIENLVRRVVKGGTLPHINTLVDVYNAISLRYLVPVGGEDLDKIKGEVVLTFATANEAPVRLLGEAEERPPRLNEVIYKDDISAICRRWNWKEADRTKFTEHTKHAFLVIEGLSPVDRSLIEQAVNELARLVKQYCGGQVTTGTIHKENPQLVLNQE
jgi:lysyl-tRNA synthetase class 2